MTSEVRPPLFELTRALVADAERQVIGATVAGRTWDPIRRRLLFPFRFLSCGLSEALHSLQWWRWVGFALILLAFYFYRSGHISTEVYLYGPTIISVFLLLLVFFAVPSTFALDTIKTHHIEALADLIEKLGFKTEEELKLLEANLEIVSERSTSRTTAALWVIGGGWGFYLYFFNQFHSAGLRLEPEKMRSIFFDNMFQLVAIGVGLSFCIFAIVCHKKAMDLVFRRLRFATNELKYRHASNAE